MGVESSTNTWWIESTTNINITTKGELFKEMRCYHFENHVQEMHVFFFCSNSYLITLFINRKINHFHMLKTLPQLLINDIIIVRTTT